MFFKLFGSISLCEACFNTEAFKGDLELIVRSTVEKTRRYEVVAGLKNVVQCQKLSGLARAGREAGNATFECGNAFLKNVRRWILNACIIFPNSFKAKRFAPCSESLNVKEVV
jgi:hypothetical protein